MNAHKVIWQEGMLLRPQHFQHNDRYYDHQLKTRTQLLGRYSWGLLKLDLDVQSLDIGKLGIKEASGILPDGSLFDLGGATEQLVIEVPPHTKGVPIYLALPLVIGNHIEARRAEQSDVLARYTVYEAEIYDSNAGDAAARQISCGRPQFKLLLGEQQSDDGYVKLKVCEVFDTTADGKVSLATDFVPTYLQAHASSYLLSCLKEVISLLNHRGDTIAERIRSSAKVSGAEVGDFMMLQLINRTELLLRHYLGLQQVHPEELYRVLLTMLGELATFSSDSKRPRLDSSYQHGDQGTCFRKLMDAIRQVLSMVLERHAIELKLEQRPYGVVVSMLHDRKLLGSASFVLAVSADCDSEELRQRLPMHLKVGSLTGIRDLVNLHLPGIKVRPLPVAPRQIAFHANKTYFVLQPGPEELKLLASSGGFAFHVSGEFTGLDLKFWAIRS